MFRSMGVWTIALTTLVALTCALPSALADEALDKAFNTLKTYDWGADRSALEALDKAVAASHGDAKARKALESRLVAVLGTSATGASKDIVCRKLSLVGSAASVPALTALLTDKKLSHMARYALERMPCPEAVKALRGSLSKVSGRLKVGVVNSLGARRDGESTSALTALLGDKDQEVAGSAAAALGAIGTPESAKALGNFQAEMPAALRPVAADAYLTCAERLLADGKELDAIKIYKTLNKPDQPKHVQLAARRGMLSALKKKK